MGRTPMTEQANGLDGSQELPNVLYKYRSWSNPLHKRLLTDNEIFFAKPSSFNDPFDCQLAPIYEDATAGNKRRTLMKESVNAFPGMSYKKRSRLVTQCMIESNDPRVQQERKEEWLRRLEDEIGVFSLTASRTSIAMWAHYAASHWGVCVGFRTDYLEDFSTQIFKNKGFLGVFYKVKYVDDYPVINLFDPKRVPGEGFNIAVTTKSRNWEYEAEYRLLLTRPGPLRNYVFTDEDRTYALGDEAIASVIMGCKMSAGHREDVKAVLRKKRSEIGLFEARMKETSYDLDFEKVTY